MALYHLCTTIFWNYVYFIDTVILAPLVIRIIPNILYKSIVLCHTSLSSINLLPTNCHSSFVHSLFGLMDGQEAPTGFRSTYKLKDKPWRTLRRTQEPPNSSAAMAESAPGQLSATQRPPAGQEGTPMTSTSPLSGTRTPAIEERPPAGQERSVYDSG